MTEQLETTDQLETRRGAPCPSPPTPSPPTPSPPTPDCPSQIVTPTGCASSGSRLVDRHLASGARIGPLDPPTGRVVVLAPHPLDESMATGGLIARQRARHRDVVIVTATDVAPADRHGVAQARRRHQLDALELLGVDRTRLLRLELPSGEVADHVDDVAAQLAELVDEDAALVAPATFDRHRDHEACGRAAVAVARRTGCRLLGSLSWAHHRLGGTPHRLRLAALLLTDDELGRRRDALGCHLSRMPDGSTGVAPWSDDVVGLLEHPVEYYVVPHDDLLRRDGPGRATTWSGTLDTGEGDGIGRTIVK